MIQDAKTFLIERVCPYKKEEDKKAWWELSESPKKAVEVMQQYALLVVEKMMTECVHNLWDVRIDEQLVEQLKQEILGQ